MIIKYNDFINESISILELEMKKGIIIHIDTIQDFNKIKNDLDNWGISFNENELTIDEAYDQTYYPVDLFISIPIIDFVLFINDPYGRSEHDDEMSEYVLYESVSDFYNDINVLNFVKNKGKILPDYNPRGSNKRKV